jgi:hypothetical protein
VANPAHALSTPVVFLFNGGEETLSQAANGFFTSSRSARRTTAPPQLEMPMRFTGRPAWLGRRVCLASPILAGRVLARPHTAAVAFLATPSPRPTSTPLLLPSLPPPPAFLLSSPRSYARGLGAFINLESTGPWGPAVVFQHTGDWSLAAFARAAPRPRGTTMAQDFFDLGGRLVVVLCGGGGGDVGHHQMGGGWWW